MKRTMKFAAAILAGLAIVPAAALSEPCWEQGALRSPANPLPHATSLASTEPGAITIGFTAEGAALTGPITSLEVWRPSTEMIYSGYARRVDVASAAPVTVTLHGNPAGTYRAQAVTWWPFGCTEDPKQLGEVAVR